MESFAGENPVLLFQHRAESDVIDLTMDDDDAEQSFAHQELASPASSTLSPSLGAGASHSAALASKMESPSLLTLSISYGGIDGSYATAATVFASRVLTSPVLPRMDVAAFTSPHDCLRNKIHLKQCGAIVSEYPIPPEASVTFFRFLRYFAHDLLPKGMRYLAVDCHYMWTKRIDEQYMENIQEWIASKRPFTLYEWHTNLTRKYSGGWFGGIAGCGPFGSIRDRFYEWMVEQGRTVATLTYGDDELFLQWLETRFLDNYKHAPNEAPVWFARHQPANHTAHRFQNIEVKKRMLKHDKALRDADAFWKMQIGACI